MTGMNRNALQFCATASTHWQPVEERERTLQEYQELGKAAGFARVSVVVSIDFLSVLEFNKA
jgi:hypothetical protein